MKPKVFIGSSVEGLNVSYSIQQNLIHDAEVTVWDQGVFELSKTTIESLINILEKSDFGIFVFSNDDIVKMRDEEHNIIRDNVLFEFGLFIGKLSRERVYFIIPSNSELRLPTDLLGLTAGQYDSNREDGSMQAATGPVSNQIRQNIKKIGKINPEDEIPTSSENKSSENNLDSNWMMEFYQDKFKDAKKKLKSILRKEKEPDRIIETKAWIAYCDFKINETDGIIQLDKIVKDNSDIVNAHIYVSRIYLWEDYLEKSIEILTNAIEKFGNETDLILRLSECYKKHIGYQKAAELLSSENPTDNPKIALKLTEYLTDEKENLDARKIIHKCYKKFPNNREVKFKYALITQELKEDKISLFLLNSLVKEEPENYQYWAYLSNSALILDFYDLAFVSCNKALELTKHDQGWLKANIGNMLNNKGFFQEAIKYLNEGLEIDKNSEYTHNRLASAIKNKESEKEKIQVVCKEGRQLIREFKEE